MEVLAIQKNDKLAIALSTKRQMKLSNFCNEYDIARTTALEWVHSRGFPAYNICGRWYVDIENFLKWREHQHKKSYEYG